MTQRTSAIVRLEFPSEKEEKIMLKALKPEIESSPRHRSKVQLIQQGRELIIIFEAEDTTALRASLNSFLRWLHLLHTVYETLESSTQ